MVGGVPVLRLDDVLELSGQRVDRLDDLVTPGDGKIAAGEEVVLHVDDNQRVFKTKTHAGNYCAAEDEDGAIDEASAGAEGASAGAGAPVSRALQSSKVYLALAPLPVTTAVTSVTRSALVLVSCSSVKPASRYFWLAPSSRLLPRSTNTA